MRKLIDKKKISDNLRTIEAMTQDGASPPLDEYWDVIVDMLSQDLEETRQFLLDCDPHDIWLMGGYFEDISYRLQSKEFIELLKELQQKHPGIDMKLDIQWAEDALD